MAASVQADCRQREAVDARDAEGMTALHVAAENGDAATVRALLACGADVNARDNYGMTPVYIAVKEGGAAAIAALVDHGADVNLRVGGSGKTALFAAMRFGQARVFDLLLARGANLNTRSLHSYEARDASRTPEQLLELCTVCGIDNRCAHCGGSVLHEISAQTDPAMVRAAIARGLPADDKDEAEWTPLHLAAFHDLVAIARVLLQSNAYVNARERSGLTPLHLARTREMAELLVAAGARIDARAGRLTPRQAAEQRGEQAVFDYLLSLERR
jgi:ankyrin repeat protein